MLVGKNEEVSKEKTKISAELYEWADALVYALIFIVLIFTLVFRITGVEGHSMEPTLQDKDSLVLSKFFYSPKQGDIVVVSKPSFHKEPIVKRIIAVAGQSVDIDFSQGIVYVDGKALDEPYIMEKTTSRGTVQFPLEVPEGFIFVMGDNRNASTDSRFSAVGLIDERMIMGKVLFRLLPLSSIGKLD